MAAFAADFFFMNCIDIIGISLPMSRGFPIANVNTFLYLCSVKEKR